MLLPRGASDRFGPGALETTLARQQMSDCSWTSARLTNRKSTDYLLSHSLCCCFWVSCFWCLTARFSLRERPGFLDWLLGLDFSPMASSVWSDGGRGPAYPDHRHRTGSRRDRTAGRRRLPGHGFLLRRRPRRAGGVATTARRAQP